jgi:hypothetical protein
MQPKKIIAHAITTGLGIYSGCFTFQSPQSAAEPDRVNLLEEYAHGCCCIETLSRVALLLFDSGGNGGGVVVELAQRIYELGPAGEADGLDRDDECAEGACQVTTVMSGVEKAEAGET